MRHSGISTAVNLCTECGMYVTIWCRELYQPFISQSADDCNSYCQWNKSNLHP